MKARTLSMFTLVFAGIGLQACQGLFALPEGQQAGECSDDADNDADSRVDCDDPDCLDAVNCTDDDYLAFFAEMIVVACDKLDECDLFSSNQSYEECLAYSGAYDSEGHPFQCEDYDAVAAEECVEAWQTVTCADYHDGDAVSICYEVCSNY